MRETLLIVDDFLDNAAGLREAALRLTYAPQQDGRSGRNALERINIDGLAQQVSWLVNETLAPTPTHESHARCRLTLGKDNAQAKVHAEEGGWSGILHLSRDEGGESGTDFYRHIRTDTDGVATGERELAAAGYRSFSGMCEAILEQDGAAESRWDPIMHVPVRFNRLLLYRPWLWHKAGPGFGDRPENGRLVYSMVFGPAVGT